MMRLFYRYARLLIIPCSLTVSFQNAIAANQPDDLVAFLQAVSAIEATASQGNDISDIVAKMTSAENAMPAVNTQEFCQRKAEADRCSEECRNALVMLTKALVVAMTDVRKEGNTEKYGSCLATILTAREALCRSEGTCDQIAGLCLSQCLATLCIERTVRGTLTPALEVVAAENAQISVRCRRRLGDAMAREMGKTLAPIPGEVNDYSFWREVFLAIEPNQELRAQAERSSVIEALALYMLQGRTFDGSQSVTFLDCFSKVNLELLFLNVLMARHFENMAILCNRIAKEQGSLPKNVNECKSALASPRNTEGLISPMTGEPYVPEDLWKIVYAWDARNPVTPFDEVIAAVGQ